MFGTYWRHMGWGEPAALNHVVHYVYAQHGAGADPGDVYYIRSTDSGVTFSAPLKLNTDATTTAQWQPNLSVNANGSLFVMWYDGREGTGCTPGVNTPCYGMWGRKSTDNGVSWQADMAYSDVISPLPGQPDPNVTVCYAGDYDYGSAIATKHVSSWVDGRVLIGGNSQQDAFFDREPPSASATPTPTPTPGPITLSAAKRKVNGINTVRLTWSGATSTNVDVYRNAVVIVTTANDGSYIDSTGDTGRARYVYKVCEGGTQTCSNEVTVTFRH